MTYLAFLILFIVLPVIVLSRWGPRELAVRPDLSFRRSMLLVAGIAFIYTTPWDNYLVYAGVWSYGEDRVLGTIFYVPYEEYAFFLLQPLMTGLWLRTLLARRGATGAPVRLLPTVMAATAFLMTVAGWALLLFGPDSTRYSALIMAWAPPVIVALGLFARNTVARFGRAALAGIGVPTLYLWICDRLAIGDGIWTIVPATSLGVNPLGLPIEEALFFLLTNVLVVLGLLTFMYGRGRND